LFNSIPPGPTGAKARFYFWATALARRPSGENQFYTALALHELFDANSNVLSKDELVRAQALKAYRSDNLFRTDARGFLRLVEGDPILVLSLLLDWGYTYQPANPPNFNDGVVTVIEG
jgi:hypothetical protein